jgi:hypothetical protein
MKLYVTAARDTATAFGKSLTQNLIIISLAKIASIIFKIAAPCPPGVFFGLPTTHKGGKSPHRGPPRLRRGLSQGAPSGLRASLLLLHVCSNRFIICGQSHYGVETAHCLPATPFVPRGVPPATRSKAQDFIPVRSAPAPSARTGRCSSPRWPRFPRACRWR